MSQSDDPITSLSTTLNCLMMVLLCLFVMLNALAVPNQPKQTQAMEAIATSFPSRDRLLNDYRTGGFSRKIGGIVSGNSLAERFGAVSEVAKGGEVDIRAEAQELRLTISSDLIFEPGDDRLDDTKLEFLHRLVSEIQKQQLKVSIEVHTDDQIDLLARFPSLWPLSVQRAQAMYRLFRSYGIPEEQVEAAGFSQFHPVFSNETDEGRKKNRRVVLVLRSVD